LFQKYRYHIWLHVIIFMWGFTGILGKLIHLDAVIIVWYRVIIAALFLVFYFIWMKKSFSFPLKHAWKIILVGMIVAGHWMTFYYSIQLSTASLGILCLSTTTLHVTWIEPIVMKRKFSWMEFLFGLLVIFGIYFVAHDFNETEKTALYFGLVSALLAACFSVFNGRLAQDVESAHITLYELITGIVFISFVLGFSGKLNASKLSITLSDGLWLLFLGIVCTSFAFLMTIEIVKRLGAFTVSLSINLEPVYTIILAIFILKEHKLLNINFYLGSLIIILVVIANGLYKNWLNNTEQKTKMTENGIY
jgi:drug/metabolite transporter (DMT)-like permease